MEVSEFCRRNGIILLFLPSNATWCFQPLDVGVFKEFHVECRFLLGQLEALGRPVCRYAAMFGRLRS
jgi:hypothetical protein